MPILLLLPLLLLVLGFQEGPSSEAEEVGSSSETFLSEDDATELALADEEVSEELAGHDRGYQAEAAHEDGEWTVRFIVDEEGFVGGLPLGTGEKEVARVGVDDATSRLEYAWTGDQVSSRMARDENSRGEPYGGPAGRWYVWGPLALLFALAFWRADKLYSLRNLDVLVLLSFLVSHGLIRAGEDLYWAVLFWYPPLLYLFFRTLFMGFGIGERVEKTSNFSAPVLLALGALASILVVVLLPYSYVIDIGIAGLAGAVRLLSGILPYGNIPFEVVPRGDTYGPLNYLVYAPFAWLFGESSYPLAAQVVTALAFVGGAMMLFLAGHRYAGSKGGAALLFAWAVFPYTVYATNNNTNDVIVAAVMAIGLAMAASPLARGAVVAAGFAIKLFPLALGPLWMLHDGPRRNPILKFVLGGSIVILLTFWVLLIDGDPVGGFGLFYEKTFAHQGTRESPWTIFTQIPQLAFLQRPLMVAVILLGLLLAAVPKKRTIRRLAALCAAMIIGLQLTLDYWTYFYIIWFEPFVFLALLLATDEKTALDGEASGDQPSAVSDPEG